MSAPSTTHAPAPLGPGPKAWTTDPLANSPVRRHPVANLGDFAVCTVLMAACWAMDFAVQLADRVKAVRL